MSYPERKTIVQILTGAAILVSYCIYALGHYQAGTAGSNELKFWATTILIFLGISIVASIVIQIIFHILQSIGIAVHEKIQNVDVEEKEIEKSIQAEMVEDEMDKLIELKSMRVGFIFAGVGFVAGLVALVLDYSAAVMVNIFFLSFFVESLFEGGAQLYYYRRGI